MTERAQLSACGIANVVATSRHLPVSAVVVGGHIPQNLLNNVTRASTALANVLKTLCYFGKLGRMACSSSSYETEGSLFRWPVDSNPTTDDAVGNTFACSPSHPCCCLMKTNHLESPAACCTALDVARMGAQVRSAWVEGAAGFRAPHACFLTPRRTRFSSIMTSRVLHTIWWKIFRPPQTLSAVSFCLWSTS